MTYERISRLSSILALRVADDRVGIVDSISFCRPCRSTRMGRCGSLASLHYCAVRRNVRLSLDDLSFYRLLRFGYPAGPRPRTSLVDAAGLRHRRCAGGNGPRL